MSSPSDNSSLWRIRWDGWESFTCSRCARQVTRPRGAETWHSCGEYIRKTTLDDAMRRIYTEPILESLTTRNELMDLADQQEQLPDD